jgi:hypothetical protein
MSGRGSAGGLPPDPTTQRRAEAALDEAASLVQPTYVPKSRLITLVARGRLVDVKQYQPDVWQIALVVRFVRQRVAAGYRQQPTLRSTIVPV